MPDPWTCDACPELAAVQWLRRSATEPDATEPVYACIPHAISLDSAARVHRVGCTAPDPKTAPACSCTPEPLPEQEPEPAPSVTLPTGWNIPAT